jgi:Zinc dependent phospholipase C
MGRGASPGRLRPGLVIAGVALLVSCSRLASGYAVLTHEAIIDAEWDSVLVPLLRQRFPNATSDQIKAAHAYAYGGSVIQDMGYYPLSSRFFSHLTHYVRTGDFVQALFEESRDLNDYAFALGALSHYEADIEGHSIAVNHCVPLLYPRLHRKYGNWITWEDSPWAHVLTEFGFDTLEVVARHNAPQAYRDWIGFQVPKPVLERAFQKTYGIKLSHQILSVDLSIAAYRRIANKFIPEMTEVAWALRREQLEERASSAQHQELYHLSRKCYQDWLKAYTKPGPGDKITAFLFRLFPKFGPLNVFEFHTPTVRTEQLFADSLKATVDRYNARLALVGAARYDPPDMNLDTGFPTRPGQYVFCDRTYATLLHKLRRSHFAGLTPALRENLLSFYADSVDNYLRRKPEKWRQLSRDLAALKSAGVSSEPGQRAPLEAKTPGSHRNFPDATRAHE